VLDSFEAMYREANQSVVSPHGRITLHIFWELIYNFIPNYCYNSTTDRFVLSNLPTETAERDAPPKGQVNMLYGSKQLKEAYQSIFTLYEGFVGPIHFQSLSKLLGYHGIAMLLEQLLNVIQSSVRGRVMKDTKREEKGKERKRIEMRVVKWNTLLVDPKPT
jgi:cytoplasmic FMR1 interacting protein